MLLIAPVTLAVCDRLRLPAVPFLIAEVFASNIGGTATLIGDPPNIIIASRAGLSFNDFLIHLAPIVAVMLVVFLGLCRFLFRDALREPRDGPGPRATAVLAISGSATRSPTAGCSSDASSSWRWSSPPSCCTRHCTSSRRWSRCSAPA